MNISIRCAGHNPQGKALDGATLIAPTAPHPSLLRKATFPQGKAFLRRVGTLLHRPTVHPLSHGLRHDSSPYTGEPYSEHPTAYRPSSGHPKGWPPSPRGRLFCAPPSGFRKVGRLHPLSQSFGLTAPPTRREPLDGASARSLPRRKISQYALTSKILAAG